MENLENLFCSEEIKLKRKHIKETILNIEREQRGHETNAGSKKLGVKAERLEPSNNPNYKMWLMKMNQAEFHFIRSYSASIPMEIQRVWL